MCVYVSTGALERNKKVEFGSSNLNLWSWQLIIYNEWRNYAY